MDKNRARITIKLGQAVYSDCHKKTEVAPIEEKTVVDQVEVEEKESHQIDEGNIYGPKYVPSKRKKHKSSFISRYTSNSKGMVRFISLMTGAIAIGLIFGYIVLTFFKTSWVSEATTALAVKPDVSSVQEQPVQPGEVAEVPESPTIMIPEEMESISIHIPERIYYVIQGGVFKDEASATDYAKDIQSKGWPNRFMGDEPTHLYLGIASDRVHASTIAAQFEDVDVYVKELTTEAKEVSASVKQAKMITQDKWDHWFTHEQVFIEVVENSILNGLSVGKLNIEHMKKITDAHRDLLQSGREVVNALSAEQQKTGTRLLNEFTKSVAAIEQYEKQPTTGHLWQAEQALLDAFFTKQQLHTSFQ